MNITLPDLKHYKASFQKKGLLLPLPIVEFKQDGLIKYLPEVDKNGWPWNEETNPAIYNEKINWPKITIITPSYNQSNFIEQTIRSVLLQNYPNLEYIIIDGGSTDHTKEILERYSPWISYWQSEKDGGQGNAINQGFSIASGDYYAWINSDDYYLPKTLKKVVEKFEHTQARFVYGYAREFLVKQNCFKKLNKTIRLLDYTLRLPTLPQPSCFWANDIHQPIWEDLSCSLDYELWLRIVKGNKKTQIKEVLSVANIHDDAKTSDPKMKEAWHNDHLLICNKNAHGPVHNWKTINLVHRVRLKINQLFEKNH
ncbi:glycosyltransferase involved in cell wall biosynthesis [Pedobacter sp. UYP30]|uniref:glycosyltransferase family 2 protein n=1 Tax=Pedobacter sp. UYP30 TaxID=1756400 RepID=UPI003398C104